MAEQTAHFAGNLTRDPELTFLDNGTAVCNFTLAFTPSYLDDRDREWIDRETVFVDCTAWRQLAENIGNSARKGHRVMVEGVWRQQNWEDRDTGAKRSKVCLEVRDGGASMMYGETRFKHLSEIQGGGDNRSQGSQRGGGQRQGSQRGGRSRQGSQRERGGYGDYDDDPRDRGGRQERPRGGGQRGSNRRDDRRGSSQRHEPEDPWGESAPREEPPADDPWGAAPPAGSAPIDDEPPF